MGGQIKRCKLASSRYVSLERSQNDDVFCQSRTHRVRELQKRIFIQDRDKSSPAVAPAAAVVAVAAAGWVTA